MKIKKKILINFVFLSLFCLSTANVLLFALVSQAAFYSCTFVRQVGRTVERLKILQSPCTHSYVGSLLQEFNIIYYISLYGYHIHMYICVQLCAQRSFFYSYIHVQATSCPTILSCTQFPRASVVSHPFIRPASKDGNDDDDIVVIILLLLLLLMMMVP